MEDEVRNSPDEAPAHISTRQRFHNTLSERAKSIKCVRADIYTSQLWQLALNFVLAGGAIALLVLSMVYNEHKTALLVSAIASVAVVAVYNVVLRAVAPMSFLQYTAVQSGKRYTFLIISKTRAMFSDGENTVEVDRLEFKKRGELPYNRCRSDFFADMDVDVRIGKADREIFKGTLEDNGRTYKCKVVFKNGALYGGVVGGIRIKYFDVNDTGPKFYVPNSLQAAVESFDIEFPKLDGVHVRDMHENLTKQ